MPRSLRYLAFGAAAALLAAVARRRRRPNAAVGTWQPLES